MKAIVLGSDIEAVVAARELAKGGMDVVLVGENNVPSPSGGGSGWGWGSSDVWASAILPDATRLDFTADIARTAEAIGRISARDAERWPRFCERLHALAVVLEDIYSKPPPDPLTHQTGGLVDLLRTGLRLRKLGAAGTNELLRLLPMSAADLLDAWFENDAVKGVLGAVAVRHLAQGPRSGGTAFNLLHHHVGCAPGVFGRPPRERYDVPEAPNRIEANAMRIEVADGRARGVVLDDGRTLDADVVVSALDPKRTLLGLVDAACLDPELVRALRNIRSRGVAARLTFTLNAPPDFETLVIAPSLDYIERAHDDSKYGRVSAAPVIEATHDGEHRVHAHVQYVPYALREGTWDGARFEALADAAIAKIDAASRGFADRVVESRVLTPAHLEAQYGWPQGQAYHAEIALDQVLWMRPLPQLARYRTPIGSLYLCGVAMHPGGVLPGAAGAHAASTVLKD
ncbi:MAG TPA: NAD(P)/FAD-dependent oxidoreductase [Burkholderiales bacterium]|nr:NAD(P)/FAD-dependent oxidoreductase [Burkholderiales bacterium]